jgi:Holliday junction DNA helicase RuvA
MIAFLNGEIVEKQPTRLLLDVSGVGYEVLIPLSSYDSLGKVGTRCRIITHDHIREDQHVLFGFMTEAEKKMFLLLLSISGVGPKLALSALSGMSVRELKVSIVDGDVKRISSISGIGKKMAERIAVELRHKISAGEALEAVAGGNGVVDSKLRDSIMALVALGYKQEIAHKKAADVIAKSVGKDLSVEEIIKQALSK